MAILRIKEIRKLEEKELNKRTDELKLELSKERANINIGAPVTSPGRVREIRKTVARILTVKNERLRPAKVSVANKLKAEKFKQEVGKKGGEGK